MALTVDGGLLAPLLIPAVAVVLIVMKRRGATNVQCLAGAAFVVYLWGVASETLLPVFIGPGVRGLSAGGDLSWAHINLVPFEGFGTGSTARQQILLNVLLGVPFGLIVPLIKRMPAWSALSLGLAFTLAIEGLQLVENWFYNGQFRTVDINDVMLNWLGVTLGYAACRIAAVAFNLSPGRDRPGVPGRP